MQFVCNFILLLAGALVTFNSNYQAAEPAAFKAMSTPALGYVILYAKDVAASLQFYEAAFGLSRRFFNDDNGKAYGEVETGGARLAFASHELAKSHLKQDIVFAAPEKAPLGFEIALVTTDVDKLYSRAVKAGATSVSAPAAMPWGQTVAYVRDNDGHIVELCTPVGG